MGYFYFDESVHERAGFILGAFVYSEEPLDLLVAAALEDVGLQPGIDEFKSGARADGNPVHSRLRSRLNALADRIGLVVAPSEDRHLLGRDALLALKKITEANRFKSPVHETHFDEGIFSSQHQAETWGAELGLSPDIRVFGKADSRHVGGIQVADLAAHTMATMLSEHLGSVTKSVKAGENSGYDPNLDIDIGFALWATLRNRFFMKERAKTSDPDSWDPNYDVSSCGLFVSPRCESPLLKAAEERFGVVYLGCIH